MPAFDERPNGNGRQWDDLRLRPKFVGEVHDKDERQVEICRNKGCSTPMTAHKCRKTSGEKKNDIYDQRDPSYVWLKRCCPWELLKPINSLRLASIVESEIDNADTDQVH